MIYVHIRERVNIIIHDAKAINVEPFPINLATTFIIKGCVIYIPIVKGTTAEIILLTLHERLTLNNRENNIAIHIISTKLS